MTMPYRKAVEVMRWFGPRRGDLVSMRWRKDRQTTERKEIGFYLGRRGGLYMFAYFSDIHTDSSLLLVYVPASEVKEIKRL